MRTVRSFDPCLPCGVHMYLGNGKTLETVHSPMFGVGRSSDERGRQNPTQPCAALKSWWMASMAQADPAAAAPARELVSLILDLHGIGLARLLAVIARSDEGATLLARLIEDEQVRAMLAPAWAPS